MGLTKESYNRLKNRTAKSAANYDKQSGGSVIDFSQVGISEPVYFKPGTGRGNINEIDILPFLVTQDWYKDLLTFYGEATTVPVGEPDYKLEYPIHRNVGPKNRWVLCLKNAFGQPCAACDHRDQNQEDEELYNSLRVAWRVVYNVYDYNNPNNDFHFWDYSYHLFEKFVLGEIHASPDPDPENIGSFWHPEEGKTIQFRGIEKSLGKNKFIEAQAIEFLDRETYSLDVVDDTISLDKLLTIPSYEEVASMITGLASESSASTDTSTKKPVRNRGRSQKKESPDECPDGYEFGSEWNDHPECNECQVFTECQELYAKEQEEPEDVPPPEDDKPPARSTRKRPSRGSSGSKPARRRRR